MDGNHFEYLERKLVKFIVEIKVIDQSPTMFGLEEMGKVELFEWKN